MRGNVFFGIACVLLVAFAASLWRLVRDKKGQPRTRVGVNERNRDVSPTTSQSQSCRPSSSEPEVVALKAGGRMDSGMFSSY